MNRTKKICNECGKEDYLFSKGRCKSCSQKSYAKKTMESKTEIRNKDNRFYTHIWATQPHTCYFCGVSLGYTMRKYFFFHILPKAKYPNLRHDDNNMVLSCMDCHHTWHFGKPTDKMRELYEKTKEFFGFNNF